MNKNIINIILVLIVLLINILGYILLINLQSNNCRKFEYSSASYTDVIADAGYGDTLDERKFNEKYRYHWMTWNGELTYLDKNGLAITLEKNIQLLVSTEENIENRYKIPSKVSVRFLLIFPPRDPLNLWFGGVCGRIIE